MPKTKWIRMPGRRSTLTCLVLASMWFAAACDSRIDTTRDSAAIETSVAETTRDSAAIETSVAETTRDSAAIETSVAEAAPTSPVGVEITEVHQDFRYFGACGNETTRVGVTVYYPLFREEQVALDKSQYPVRPLEAVQSGGTLGLRRVGEPGPGDDVGVMVIYADGMARFESMSGRVIWLTSEERIYNWVC
jgi:hypothetical protein